MIYLSACCIPDRIANKNSFDRFLYGLINQKTYLSYKIVLNIPKKFINYGTYNIPDWLTMLANKNNIIILRDEIDYGPISNIIYPLKNLNTNKNDTLIICDDDHLYHEDMIDYHMLKLNHYPSNHSICFRGNHPMELRTWVDHDTILGKFYNSCVLFPTPHDIYLKFPDHWHSVSYRVKNLNLDYLLDTEFLSMTWNNDLLMGYYGWDNNILYLCANYYKEIDYRPVNYDGRSSNSFPIKEMLPFESNSGCNIFRSKNKTDIWDNKKFLETMNKDKGIIIL